MSNSVGYERRKAVANAWKNEKGYVLDGKGTRDWNQKEQKEIIAKGKAKGYQGHHMKSVDGHTTKAGDTNNIQFLTRKEHLDAHKGNYHNNTNGRYDPKTGEMHDFGRNKASIDTNNLSSPLSTTQRNAAKAKSSTSSTRIEAARNKARTTEARSINKTKSENNTATPTRTTQSKTLSGQRNNPSKSALGVTTSKTLSAQRRASPKGTSTTKSASLGKTTSSGKGVSSGKGSTHSH